MRKISKKINPVFIGKAWASYMEMRKWKQKYNTTFEKFLESFMFIDVKNIKK
jgi:hypothetical protein